MFAWGCNKGLGYRQRRAGGKECKGAQGNLGADGDAFIILIVAMFPHICFL